MRQTEYITEGMKEALLPTCGYSNLCEYSDEVLIGTKDFRSLQTFPHIGDIVFIHEDNQVPHLMKVGQITWDNEDIIRIYPKQSSLDPYRLNRVYPIILNPYLLKKMGFVKYYWGTNPKWGLRLKSYPDIKMEENRSGYGYLIQGIGNIKYLHELLAILRAFKVDRGLIDNKLGVKYSKKEESIGSNKMNSVW